MVASCTHSRLPDGGRSKLGQLRQDARRRIPEDEPGACAIKVGNAVGCHAVAYVRAAAYCRFRRFCSVSSLFGGSSPDRAASTVFRWAPGEESFQYQSFLDLVAELPRLIAAGSVAVDRASRFTGAEPKAGDTRRPLCRSRSRCAQSPAIRSGSAPITDCMRRIQGGRSSSCVLCTPRSRRWAVLPSAARQPAARHALPSASEGSSARRSGRWNNATIPAALTAAPETAKTAAGCTD